jgi:hypothetical protein
MAETAVAPARDQAAPVRQEGPRTACWVAGVAGVTAAVGALGLTKPFLIYDSGITTSAATFMLHGRLPYRDFGLLYGPAAGWLAMLPTALLGPNLLAVRLLGLLVVVAQAVVGFLLVRRWAAPLAAAAVSVAGALALVAFNNLDLPAWGLALLAATGALLAAGPGTPRALGWAGVLAGLAFLVRLDVGGYVLLSLVVGTRKVRPLLGFAACVAPFAIWALVAVPLPDLVRQLLWYPLVGQKRYHDTPLPAVLDAGGVNPRALLETYVHLGGPLVVALAGLAVWRRPGLRPGTPPLLCFAALCLLQDLSSTDMWHAGQVVPPVLMLLGILLFPPGRPVSRARGALGALGALVALPLAVLMAYHGAWRGPYPAYNRQVEVAARLVRDATAPGEPIFVGEIHHRYTFTNPLIVYYLADRPAGVRDTMFLQGLTTTVKIQRRMVADLERSRTRYLVLDRRFADKFAAPGALQVRGAGVLDQHIAANFEVEDDLGDLVVLRRRDR